MPMKIFTLGLTILGFGTLAVILGNEVDVLIPHSVSQCQTAQDQNGDSYTHCVTISVTGHIG